MPLLELVVILIVIGVGLYLINRVIPMDANVKTILNVVVILVICLWLLSVFMPGAWSSFRIGGPPNRHTVP